MKSLIFKLILLINAVCSIYSLNMRYNMKSKIRTEDLTFYQMAIHKRIHSGFRNDTGGSNGTASNQTGGAQSAASMTKNATNTVGNLATADTIIENRPYKLKRCDQVLAITAKKLGNYDDFTSRKEAFFTMSAYMINEFEKRDTNTLIESISLDHIRIMPTILQGSKSCLRYQDSINYRNISLCLDDVTAIEEVNKFYRDLMNCRVGGDLKEIDPVIINSILEASCNGFNQTVGVDFDLPKIRSDVATELKQAGFSVQEVAAISPSTFGINNATQTQNITTPDMAQKFVDLRVPGTY